MTSSQQEDLVPTLSSRLRHQSAPSAPPQVEVVQFSSYKRKSREVKEEEEALVAGRREEEVDMREARYEIMRFGMRRMSRGEKEKTKEKIAVELGAKPDKNVFTNYKQLQEARRRQRALELEERKLLEISRKTMGKKSVKKVNRSDVIKRKMGRGRNKRGGGSGIIGKYGKPTLSVPKSK